MVESRKPQRISVHQTLGGGSVADMLLWRKWFASVLVLVSATSLWVLFEQAGYNILSFAANVLLLLVVILFFWAKSASLLNRPLPPIPDLEISEESVEKAADVIRVRINHQLSIISEIAVGGNLRVLFQVAVVLWITSCIGGFCNFLTLVYFCILLSFSVPVLYDKYQDQLAVTLSVPHRIIRSQYRKVDESLLRKIPSSVNKAKKTQ